MSSYSVLVLYYANSENKSLSYQHGWPQALRQSSQSHFRLINLSSIEKRSYLSVAGEILNRKYDVILLLHSIFSNQRNIPLCLIFALSLAKAKKFSLLEMSISVCRKNKIL